MVAGDRARQARLARDLVQGRERVRRVADQITDEKEFCARMLVEHKDRLRVLEEEQRRANTDLTQTIEELQAIAYRNPKVVI